MKKLLALLLVLVWQESAFSQSHFSTDCVIHYNYVGKAIIGTIKTKTYVYPDGRTKIDISNTEREVVYYANFQLMRSDGNVHYFGFPFDRGYNSITFGDFFDSNYPSQQTQYCGPYGFPGYYETQRGKCNPYIYQSNGSFSEGKILGIFRQAFSGDIASLNSSLKTTTTPLFEYRNCSFNPDDCWVSGTLEEKPSIKSTNFKSSRRAIPRLFDAVCPVGNREFGLDDDGNPPPPECPDVVVRTIYQVGTVTYDCK